MNRRHFLSFLPFTGIKIDRSPKLPDEYGSFKRFIADFDIFDDVVIRKLFSDLNEYKMLWYAIVKQENRTVGYISEDIIHNMIDMLSTCRKGYHFKLIKEITGFVLIIETRYINFIKI